MNEVYLLSCETEKEGGGIYKYHLSSEGKLIFEKKFPCDRPMYAVLHEKALHILLRQVFEQNGGYIKLQENFSHCSDVLDSKGSVPCHLTVDGPNVYLVNYLSGNIVKNCHEITERTGYGTDPLRQDMPHTHCVAVLSDQYIGVCDLGTDTLAIYDKNLGLVTEAKVPEGYGIRHFAYDRKKALIYAVNELVPSVSIFSFRNEKLNLLHTTILNCNNPQASGAAIKLASNGKLYISVRGENVIFILDIHGEQPVVIQKADCGGNGPRDFELCGDYLICTNEKSNSVTVYEVLDGKLTRKSDEVSLHSPLCVLYHDRPVH